MDRFQEIKKTLQDLENELPILQEELEGIDYCEKQGCLHAAGNKMAQAGSEIGKYIDHYYLLWEKIIG